MSALLDSLTSTSGARVARDEAALAAILRDGLPGPRSESWKYTPLRALERRVFASTPVASDAGLDAALLNGIPAPRLVFVNGRFDAEHSDTSALPDGIALSHADGREDARFVDAGADDVFTRLNATLAGDGILLRVDDGTVIEAPVHIVFAGVAADADLAWHLRHRIELGDGASLSLVEHQVSATDHRHFANSRMAIALGERAHLRHVRVQHDAEGATNVLRTDASLAESALYQRLDLELGSALSRHELNVTLGGKAAKLDANGVLLADARRHLDTRLDIRHVARDTVCDVLWRGIGAGRGRAVFHGGITIDAGADGSDARLSNKNLLLGSDAEIDTQPVLVINADEVQAAHGATVGQLDPTAMFYLRSRGLPEADARQLLTGAFCREPLAMIDDSTLRASLEAILDTAMARQATA